MMEKWEYLEVKRAAISTSGHLQMILETSTNSYTAIHVLEMEWSNMIVLALRIAFSIAEHVLSILAHFFIHLAPLHYQFYFSIN